MERVVKTAETAPERGRPDPIVLKLRRSYRVFLMMFGLFGLIIAACGFLSPARSGPSHTWIWILPTILGICALSVCIPGASYLRLDAEGITLRHSLYRKRLRWASINGMMEDHLTVGRGGKKWGVIISITNKDGRRDGYFVSDIYTLNRTELIGVMRDLWTRATARNDDVLVR